MVWLILGCILLIFGNFLFSVMYAFYLYYKERDAMRKCDSKKQKSYRNKKRRLKIEYTKRNNVLIIICKVICFFVVAYVVFRGISIFVKAVSAEPQDINTILEQTEGDGLGNTFAQDDTIIEEEQNEESLEDKYRRILHFAWRDDTDLKVYGRKVTGCYTREGSQEDAQRSKLKFEVQREITTYSVQIKQIEELKSINGRLTEDEAYEEYKLYMEIDKLCSTAEGLYQAGRSMEDAFWAHYYAGNWDYETLIQYAALSIECFECFIGYENHIVGSGDDKAEVQLEELMYRNGKLYWVLFGCSEDTEEKQHFLRMAYACFSNIVVISNNYWSIMGDYYLGMSIAGLLEEMDVREDGYKELLEEGKAVCDKACRLYRTEKVDPENMTDVIDMSNINFLVEEDIENKLEGLKEKLNCLDKWAIVLPKGQYVAYSGNK